MEDQKEHLLEQGLSLVPVVGPHHIQQRNAVRGIGTFSVSP